jgi:hypothetical protein
MKQLRYSPTLCFFSFYNFSFVNKTRSSKNLKTSQFKFQSQSPSTGQVAKQILAEEGLLGRKSPHGGGGLLAKAITATMCRNGTFNMVYFGFYHSIKDIVPKAEVK